MQYYEANLVVVPSATHFTDYHKPLDQLLENGIFRSIVIYDCNLALRKLFQPEVYLFIESNIGGLSGNERE